MLYLVKQPSGANYDEMGGFVIRAKTNKEARQIASANCGAEGSDIWLNTNRTKCRAIKISGKSEILLEDFNAS